MEKELAKNKKKRIICGVISASMFVIGVALFVVFVANELDAFIAIGPVLMFIALAFTIITQVLLSNKQGEKKEEMQTSKKSTSSNIDEAIIKCPYCGSEYTKDEKLCPGCGSRIKSK